MTDTKKTGMPISGPLNLLTRRDVLKGTAGLGLSLSVAPFLTGQTQTGRAGEPSVAISRDALASGFREPPMEYAPIDNWWWEGGRLTREKLTWQLQEFKDKGIAGTWSYVRWAYGEALSPIPAYWSDEWWDLMRFALEEHRRLGLDAWFSTWEAIGFIQNLLSPEVKQNPEFTGQNLVIFRVESERDGPLSLSISPDDEILDAAAYRKAGDALDYASRVTLTDSIRDGKIAWKAPDSGWLLTAIAARREGLNYLNPDFGNRWNEIFLGEYEKRLREFLGTTLKAFGVDEHAILHGNTLFSRSLLSKIQSERSYDLSPYLIGLFYDVGPKTDQIRCDYYDAMSALLEENFSGAAARWLEARGMQYVTASPHNEGEPLEQTYLYGDLVRYFRAYHLTGGEDPTRTAVGERRLFSAKFASSIAHLYERKHAIMMVYFFSGWGVTQAENLAWTNENYAYGMNLYDRHGVHYALLGGWYEYAPPAIHFFQPYWRHWRKFADYVTRLSYILSQGKHRADVALLYPGTTIHANWVAGRQGSGAAEFFRRDVWESFDAPAIETTERTKELARALVQGGIDLDVMDDWSLQRATVQGPVLTVSGVEFRAIVMPPLTTVRIDSIEKIRDFYHHGGTVVSLGRLPDASAEKGRGDERVRSAIQDIFGIRPGEEVSRITSRTNPGGGKAYFVPQNVHDVSEVLSTAIERDVVASEKDVFHTHQKIGEQDVYFLFNAQNEERDLTVRFRVDGEPERWDAFTGDIQPLFRVRRDGRTTEVKLRALPYEGIVVVFSAGNTRPSVLEDNLSELTPVATGDTLTLLGFDSAAGKKSARVLYQGKEYAAQGDLKTAPPAMDLQAPFDFRLEPTMDNRWGDFRYPASSQVIGAEARRFRYFEEGDVRGTELGWQRPDFNDSSWSEVTYSYGPYWWQIGPFQPGSEPQKLLEQAKGGQIDLNQAWPRLKTDEEALHWTPYSFSRKFGTAYFEKAMSLGPLTGVSNNFLAFAPGPTPRHRVHYLFTNVHSPKEAEYVLYYGAEPRQKVISGSPQPTFVIPRRTQAWLNGEEILFVTSEDKSEVRQRVHLREGWNSVLLKIVQPRNPIGTYAVFLQSEPPAADIYVPLVRWFREPQPLVYDLTPHKPKRVGWYRFQAPPGLRSMRMQTEARKIDAWIDGRSVPVRDGTISVPKPIATVSQVALRVEQESGAYGGAVFVEPVAFECGTGQIPLGDWSQFGLATYSGIGVYGKEIDLSKDHLAGKVILELGEANTAAEVLVNEKPAGVGMSRPFRFDITKLVREGQNRLEIRVANTLANHMSTYPTPWVLQGQTLSGLLGPVRIRFLAPVELTAKAVG